MVALGLSFEACSSTNVGFSPPGDGTSGGIGGMGHAGDAGSNNGGAAGHAGGGEHAGDSGEAGTAEGGASGEVGTGGDAGEKSVAGSGGAAPGGNGGGANAGNGGGGAPNGGSAGGGAPNGGSAGGGAPNGGSAGGGAPNGGSAGGGAGGGAPNGGAPNGGAPNGGAPNGGAPNGGSAGAGAPNGGGGTGGSANAVCGNQLLELGEQCDDGNTTRLDGCNSSCAFEQSQRANWFQMQFAADAFCVTNAFGSAFPNLTHATLKQNVDARVADGSFSLLFAFLGLADPTGPNGSAFSIGVLNGTPATGTGYDGRSDLDWWYMPAATTIDGNKIPISKLTAQISNGAVQASGVRLQLPLFSTVPLNVSSVLLRLPVGASSKPLSSTGAAPGHLPAEHLSTSLTSFATGGVQTDAGAGELCGNLSAASLRSEPIPSTFLSTGATPCTQNYGTSNSLLDLLVGGCTVSAFPLTLTAVFATQPDQVDPSTTNPGAGGPYKLSAASAHVISACTDKTNAPVNLDSCLGAAAYSSAFKLATDRVIIK